MATYRISLNGTGIANKEEARKAIDSIIGQQVTKFKNAGIEAMKEIRFGAVNSWYGSGALNTMNASTICECESVKQTKEKVTITITSYVDPQKYDEIKRRNSEGEYSIYDWREKHEKAGWSWGNVSNGSPIPMGMSVSEYLIYIQWYLGIRGLPAHETSTGTGWINPTPHIEKISMSECVASALRSKWEETVYKKIKKG